MVKFQISGRLAKKKSVFLNKYVDLMFIDWEQSVFSGVFGAGQALQAKNKRKSEGKRPRTP